MLYLLLGKRWRIHFLVAIALFMPPVLPTVVSAAVVAEQPRDQQIINQDFLLAAGEVIADNVVVLNGDVVLEAGARIHGDLTVVRGDVNLDGRVDGSLSILLGTLSMGSEAHIVGDVSVTGGDVKRLPGAVIGGSLHSGESAKAEGGSRWAAGESDPDSGRSRSWHPRFPSGLLALGLNLLQALLWTLLLTGLVTLTYWLFSPHFHTIASSADSMPVLSISMGLVAVLFSIGLAAVLGITIVLMCGALLIIVLASVLTLIGWTTTATWIGQKAHRRLHRSGVSLAHPVSVSISAFCLTGLASFNWMLHPCLGAVTAAATSALGSGAFLIHHIRAASNGGEADAASPSKRTSGSGRTTSMS